MENKYFIVGKLLFVDYLFEIREKGLVGSEYTCQIIALFIHCDEAMKISKSLRWKRWNCDEIMKEKNDNFNWS